MQEFAGVGSIHETIGGLFHKLSNVKVQAAAATALFDAAHRHELRQYAENRLPSLVTVAEQNTIGVVIRSILGNADRAPGAASNVRPAPGSLGSFGDTAEEDGQHPSKFNFCQVVLHCELCGAGVAQDSK
jgi:hypothetical protein